MYKSVYLACHWREVSLFNAEENMTSSMLSFVKMMHFHKLRIS